MTDIVERLINLASDYSDGIRMDETGAMLHEAAGEIEMLRATRLGYLEENQRLRREWQAEMTSDQFKIGQRDEEIARLRAEIEKLCRDLEENEVIATALTRIVASQRAEIEKLRETLLMVTNHLVAVMSGPLIAGAGVTFENGVEGIPTIARARLVLRDK